MRVQVSPAWVHCESTVDTRGPVDLAFTGSVKDFDHVSAGTVKSGRQPLGWGYPRLQPLEGLSLGEGSYLGMRFDAFWPVDSLYFLYFPSFEG